MRRRRRYLPTRGAVLHNLTCVAKLISLPITCNTVVEWHIAPLFYRRHFTDYLFFSGRQKRSNAGADIYRLGALLFTY